MVYEEQMKTEKQQDRVAYLHGRFGPHIMHGRLAKSVNGEFQIIDKYKIWNDGPRSKLYLIYAWIYNAFAFINPGQYSIFLVSGPHFSPIIMKFFRLKSSQKVVAHLGDETMYFLYINYYGRLMKKVLTWLLNQYDALLCEGQMAADLARLNGINKPKIYTTYLGVPAERQKLLLELPTQLASNHLIVISTGPKGWRTFYKGIDLMIAAYSRAFEQEKSLQFTIVGEWDSDLQKELLKDCSEACRKSIHFVGQTSDIQHYLARASMYYHVARGDAFPTVVLEGMSAGLIPLVSEWTGSKEVVGKVDKRWVVELDEAAITERILFFTRLPLSEREAVSQKMREASKKYTEAFALEHYQETFQQLRKDLNTDR
jgi:glycosyltransferase involved in cell wall biosynthesis